MSKHKDPVYSTAIDVVNFLQTLMDNNRGFSAIGTARSALASIVTLKCGTPVGSHPLVKNFTQGVFNLKPPTPRYVDIWDPETVLKFIKSWSPAKSLSLTKLVKKLYVLILLVTGQRGQILQALTIDNMSVGKNAYTFKIENKDVKQGRRGYKPEPLILRTFPADKRLCVYHYLTVYLKRTLDIRGKIGASCSPVLNPTIHPQGTLSPDGSNKFWTCQESIPTNLVLGAPGQLQPARPLHRVVILIRY